MRRIHRDDTERTGSAKSVAYYVYDSYVSDQDDLVHNFVDQVFFTAAVTRLPNLSHVAVHRTQEYAVHRAEDWKGEKPCHPFWNRLYKEILYPPGYRDYRDPDEGDYGRLLQPLLLALSISRAKIRDLKIADMGGESGMLPRLDQSMFKLIAPAFSHLRHVDISMELYISGTLDHDNIGGIAEGFGSWLRHASLLETMVVAFLQHETYKTSQDWDDFPCQPDYLESLDNMIWPRLRKMTLRNFHTTERSLLRLICNQPSLQDLELNRIDFRLFDSDNSGGSWESIFRKLGETKGPQLRSVRSWKSRIESTAVR